MKIQTYKLSSINLLDNSITKPQLYFIFVDYITWFKLNLFFFSIMFSRVICVFFFFAIVINILPLFYCYTFKFLQIVMAFHEFSQVIIQMESPSNRKKTCLLFFFTSHSHINGIMTKNTLNSKLFIYMIFLKVAFLACFSDSGIW